MRFRRLGVIKIGMFGKLFAKEQPTRIEKMRLGLEIDPDHVTPAHFAELQRRFNAQSGDKIKLDYTIDISYFGDVVANLETIEQLLKSPGVVVAADRWELEHGRCLIAEVLARIDRVGSRLKMDFKNF